MVDISSGDKKINITVTSSGNKGNIATSPDMSMFYTERSREWAISDKLVNNEDYSSKYYAQKSKEQAQISTDKATEVVNSGNEALSNIDNAKTNALTDIGNLQNESIENITNLKNTSLSDIETSKTNAISDITNQEALSVDNVNTAGATQVNNVNSAGTTQINLAKEQVTLATTQANIATTQAEIATAKTTEVVESGNTALSNIATAKSNALSEINTTGAGYVENAEQYAQNSLTSANNAALSENNALSYKNSALESSQTATAQANIAVTNANMAVTSATNAKTSETNAKSSETRCEEILSRLGTAIKIKGRVDSIGDLPLGDNLDGDTYLVGTEGLDSYPEYYWYQDHWEFLGTSGTSLSWGLISGDITAQTDLMDKLNTKQNVLTAGTGIDITNNVISNTQTSAEWGNIQGTLANQADLQTALDSKQDKGNYALKSEIPTNNNQLTNGAGYQKASQVESAITSKGYQTASQVETAITNKGYATTTQLTNGLSTKQNTLTAGTGIDITNNVISNTQTSAEWGNIEGNIEEQTDLADYIKENSASGLQLFDLVLKDHILSYEESEGLALQGTYVYKNPVAGSRYGYPDFYEKCLEEYQNSNTDKWTQPVLTSDTSYGVVSSTSLYPGSNVYNAFNGVKVGGDKYVSNSTSGGNITWQLPEPIKFKSCKVYQTSDEASYLNRFPQTITVYGSNNGSTWTQIASTSGYSQPAEGTYVEVTSSNTTAYNYIKWEFGSAFTGANAGIAVAEIEIDADTVLKTNPNGHRFYDIANKTDIDAIYEQTGACWAYGIDTENECIFLPRAQCSIFKGQVNSAPVVGNGNSLGLMTLSNQEYSDLWASQQQVGNGRGLATQNNMTQNSFVGVTTDPAKSGIFADLSDIKNKTVTTYVYICVGSTNTVQSTTVELTSDTANAPLSFDTETGALQLSKNETLEIDAHGNLGINNTNFLNNNKESIMAWGIPDYAARVTKSWDTVYQAEKNGIVLYSTSQQYGDPVINPMVGATPETLAYLNIENATNANSIRFSNWFLVEKGYYWKIAGGRNVDRFLTFCPLKGAN